MDANGAKAPRGRSARTIAAGDAERRRLGHVLHDGVEQQLVLVGLKLGHLARSVNHNSELEPLVADISVDLNESLRLLRELANDIYPSKLEHQGLEAALGDALKRVPVPATLHCEGAERYPPELEAAVYFCCLAALRHTASHAGIAHADVSLFLAERTVRFAVLDNGRGYDTKFIRDSIGIQSMAERVEAYRGKLSIESTPGQGTTITGTIPVQPVGTIICAP